MNPAIANQQSARGSAFRMARIAGVFYAVNILTSIDSYFGPRNRLAFIAGLVATAAYIAVTVLFYFLFRPVSRNLSFLAACFSMAGGAVGWHLIPLKIDPLVFFAVYCLLIGSFILRSSFLPKFLGFLLILAGIGYAAYLWPPLGKALFPYDVIPGGVGESILTVWLLVKGVNEQRWQELARAGKKLRAESSRP